MAVLLHAENCETSRYLMIYPNADLDAAIYKLESAWKHNCEREISALALARNAELSLRETQTGDIQRKDLATELVVENMRAESHCLQSVNEELQVKIERLEEQCSNLTQRLQTSLEEICTLSAMNAAFKAGGHDSKEREERYNEEIMNERQRASIQIQQRESLILALQRRVALLSGE